MSLKSTEIDNTIEQRPILYTPPFADNLKMISLSDKELDKKFKSAAWLYGPLLEELQLSYPCDFDINTTTRE